MPRDRGAGRVYRTNEQPFYLRLASIACARRAGFRLRNPRAGLRGHASFLVRALRPSSNGKRSVTRRSPRPSFFSDGVSIIKDPDPRSARERLRGAGASHQQIPQKAAIYTQRFPGSARGSGHGRAAFALDLADLLQRQTVRRWQRSGVIHPGCWTCPDGGATVDRESGRSVSRLSDGRELPLDVLELLNEEGRNVWSADLF